MHRWWSRCRNPPVPARGSAATFLRSGRQVCLGRQVGLPNASDETGQPIALHPVGAPGSTRPCHPGWTCSEIRRFTSLIPKLGTWFCLFGTDAGAGAYPFQLFRAGKKSKDYEVLTDARVKIPFKHGDRFHNFINHLLGREALSTQIHEALAVQKILDGIAKSCESGREVKI